MLYAIAILELILWHKYKNKREKHKKKPSQVISQRPLFNKINNQWRDNKTYDFIKEYLKKT